MKNVKILITSILLIGAFISHGQTDILCVSEFDGHYEGDFVNYSIDKYDSKLKSSIHLYENGTRSEQVEITRLHNRLYDRLEKSCKDGVVSRREARRLRSAERRLDQVLGELRIRLSLNGRRNQDFLR